jgi:hypothetical protein
MVDDGGHRDASIDGQERASSMQRAVHDNATEPMCPGIDAGAGSFTTCLNRYLSRSELSLTALARRSWLDISYVSRLVHLPCGPLNPRHGDRGDKRHPSRDTVIRLGLAMQLPMEDMDELQLAVGYAPLVR